MVQPFKTACYLLLALLGVSSFGKAQWKPHVVQQLNGSQAQIKLPATQQLATGRGTRLVQMPYLVYMPEKDRLLILALCDRPVQALLMASDDHGATWSELRYVHLDAAGKPDIPGATSLTYLGAGKLMLVTSEGTRVWVWFSHDYGETWGDRAEIPPGASGKPFWMWDPFFVDRDPQTGKIARLLAAGFNEPTLAWHWGGHSQGLFRSSPDEGRTWSAAVAVPEWLGYNEITFVRAKNGNLVAACRTDWPRRLRKLGFDNYGGLGVSVSKDNGATWSRVNLLYEWGRHHPSMVVLENGDLVMSYVVREGYPDTVDGYPQYGIEAVVSHDNGETWDLDHRYLLAVWPGTLKGSSHWYAECQSTSTVLLPDGSLLTAYGTGLRSRVDPKHFGSPKPWDVGLVSWRISNQPVNAERRLADAPFDSDLRNKFDPHPLPGSRLAQIWKSRNIAVKELGAEVTASPADQDPSYLLDNGGYSAAVVTLKNRPAWVEITWPQAHQISEIHLLPGSPYLKGDPATECGPLDYRLQYRKGNAWVDLVPPVTNAQRFADWAKTAPGDDAVIPYDSFQYVHKFAPVRTRAVRLTVTRSTDLGRREGSGKNPVIPEHQRETILRGIEVLTAP